METRIPGSRLGNHPRSRKDTPRIKLLRNFGPKFGGWQNFTRILVRLGFWGHTNKGRRVKIVMISGTHSGIGLRKDRLSAE